MLCSCSADLYALEIFINYWNFVCNALQQVCLEICDHLEIELFRIPYPPRPVQAVPATSQKLPFNSSSNAGGRYNMSHDQNGAKNNARLLDDEQTQKRQTRSSKRHVVSH